MQFIQHRKSKQIQKKQRKKEDNFSSFSFLPFPFYRQPKRAMNWKGKKYPERECIANHETIIDGNRNVTSIRRKTAWSSLFISFSELHSFSFTETIPDLEWINADEIPSSLVSPLLKKKRRKRVKKENRIGEWFKFWSRFHFSVFLSSVDRTFDCVKSHGGTNGWIF